MKKLDLDTLKQVKQVFDFCSDMSTRCMGYKYICRTIEELENNIPKVEDIEKAELLIQELSEHRT